MRMRLMLNRVIARCPDFATVKHTLVSQADDAMPSAFLSPIEIAAARADMISGAQAQMCTWKFGVYVLIRRRQDEDADFGAVEEFDDLLASLRAALIGWTPDGAMIAPLQYAGGALDKYRDGQVCWRDDFITQIEMRFP
jgi:hypothetical protein